MPSIIKIHGFKNGKSRFSAPGKRLQMSETVLVQVSSDVTSPAQVVALLPSYGAPGTTGFNPKQLTFTYYQSRHPENALLYLDDVGEIAPSNEDGSLWWDVPLVYRQPPLTPLSASEQPKENRRDQKMLNPEVDNPAINTLISDPMDRKPIYSRSARIAEKETYTKPNGDPILHTNGVPIKEPIKVNVVEIVHKWIWNKTWSALNLTTLKNLEGKVNSVEISRGKLTIPARKAMVEPFDVSEEYEALQTSYGGTVTGTTIYHYARLTMTLIESPIGFEFKIPSMHTLQKKVAGGTDLISIPINARGDVAKTPWPLKTDGTAKPYAEVIAGDTTNMGFLDTGYPEEADIDGFMSSNSLTVKTGS